MMLILKLITTKYAHLLGEITKYAKKIRKH